MDDSARSLRINVEELLADANMGHAAGHGLQACKPACGFTYLVCSFACVQYGDVALHPEARLQVDGRVDDQQLVTPEPNLIGNDTEAASQHKQGVDRRVALAEEFKILIELQNARSCA